MINARMETVAEKPAYKKAFAVRRCLLPADGYFEWYPTSQKTKAGKPIKQPFFIRPKDGGTLAMAGLYEIWRDPTKDDEDPRPVPVDLHGAHDRGRGRRRPHPRPDAADGRAGPLGRLARPDGVGEGRPARPAGARRARRLEAFPVSTLVSNVRNNGPELVEPIPLAEPCVRGDRVRRR